MSPKEPSLIRHLPFVKNNGIIGTNKGRGEKKPMKKLKKIMLKFSVVIVMVVCVGTVCKQVYGQVQAVTDTNMLQEQIEYYTKNIDRNTITKEEVLKVYDAISREYSPKDVADIIEENANEIQAQGVDKGLIKAGANFIRTTDEKEIRKIIENDIDFEEIQKKIEKGYAPEEILSSVVQEMPNEKKVEIATKVVLSNKIVKTVITVLIILFIYGTILRWRIYTKAGKPGWAAIIPVYRQIVMYQVCGLSPWLMLLWLIPIFGWLAMAIIAIMKRFCLAKEFGRGSLFGFGLLFLPAIFQSILAFHPAIQKEEKEV